MSKKEISYRDMIIAHIGAEGYQPQRSKELARDLGVDKNNYEAFRHVIGQLKEERQLVRVNGSRWAPARKQKTLDGLLRVTRSGNAFLLPSDPAEDDIFIGEDYLGDALDGDKVRVGVDSPSGRGMRHFGRVLEVLERGNPRLVAIVTADLSAQPEDPKNPFAYTIIDRPPELKADTKILLETVVYPGDGKQATGKIVEILGPAGAPDTETAAILAGYNAPGPFPEEVKDEVRHIAASAPMKDRTGRLDLTELITVTIDPDTARDFDDALSIEERPDGTLVVGVHIADVSHFVVPGSKLDEEARERSTSIYLPGRVIPMLPEELSNDLCSLRPREDRFSKTVFITYSPEGERKDYHIHRSVINSRRRMTYNEVKVLIENEALAAEFEDKELLAVLRRLDALARKLRKRRLDNGSIELNMKEFIILLDEEGCACGMEEAEHDFSHELVEEFMLAANCCVAEWAHQNGLPVLHRIHESPDEEGTQELADFLTACGFTFKPPLRRDRLQDIINKVKGRPEEHAINLAILKSFKQAVYGPGSDRGHFALNFPHYLHFTSPIRRYPDLHLHQMLDTVFSQSGDKLPKKCRKAPPAGGKPLEMLGLHCSGLERRAMKIEEAVKDFRRLELLKNSEQREFLAVVTGIRKFGIFVEIENYFVEGMLPRWMIEKKGYSTREVVPGENKKKGHGKDSRGRLDKGGFHLGQEIKVRITKIDLTARSCEMELVEVL